MNPMLMNEAIRVPQRVRVMVDEGTQVARDTTGEGDELDAADCHVGARPFVEEGEYAGQVGEKNTQVHRGSPGFGDDGGQQLVRLLRRHR